MDGLVAWLHRGGIIREAPLLTLLRSSPCPSAAKAQPGHLTPSQLTAKRADGYRHLSAPLMRGSSRVVEGGGGPGPRIADCIEAMFSVVQFWCKGGGWLSQQAAVLTALQVCMREHVRLLG